MTTRTLITKDMPIAFILETRPEARRVMDKYFGEACFDCPGVMWEPLSVEAALYGRSVEDMLAEINALED
ncbi:MAG: disulfide oxidoreductase [Nitrospirae bacterium]|nr:disulfide oxidoreductase [Nitrospirota bacterium]MBI5694507.1 disulfide oxidoreductase [Nitrospirota bacterium]